MGGECGKVGRSLPAAQWMMDECAAVALCTEYRVFEFFLCPPNGTADDNDPSRWGRRNATPGLQVAGCTPLYIYVTFSALQRVTSHLCNRITWVRVLSGSDGEPCCLRVADLVDHYSLRQKQRNEKDRPTSRHDKSKTFKSATPERPLKVHSRASFSTAPSKCF